MKELIKVMVNGDVYEEIIKPNNILGSLFMINFDVYKFMSVDAIKQHMVTAIELIEEMGIKRIEKIPASVNKSIKAMKEVIKKVTKQENLLIFITNLILVKEGLGLLPGFNCAIKGSKSSALKINPEKQSIVNTK